MITEKSIAVDEVDVQFINEFGQHGFQNTAELLSRALLLLREELKQKQQLESSAKLYAEIYDADADSKQWVESSVEDWD